MQILLLEAAERSPGLENNLPIPGTTATWYEELLPDAFPLLNPGTGLRKNGGAAGKHGLLLSKSPSLGALRHGGAGLQQGLHTAKVDIY